MNIILTESQYNRLVEVQELDEGLLNTIGDIVGIFDPTGIVDLANAISYWKQGRKVFSLLSLISVVPGIDWATKPVILGSKVIKGLSESAIIGWLLKTIGIWIGGTLLFLNKLLLPGIPFISGFVNGMKTFINFLKSSATATIKESKTQKILVEHNFDKIYNELYNKMLKTICMKYSDGDYEKAQDFCQNGFIKAYEKFDQFRGENVSGWVSMVIRNYILDELRKEKNKKQVKDFDFSKYDAKEEEYDDLFMGEYSEDDIKDAINKLSPMYKKTLELYYFEDLSHDEIAKKLGVSTGTSKSNLFKAKANLKKHLENISNFN